MAEFRSKVLLALAQAQRDGFSPSHISLTADHWPTLYPSIQLKPAFRAAASVVWAYDSSGNRMVPYVID